MVVCLNFKTSYLIWYGCYFFWVLELIISSGFVILLYMGFNTVDRIKNSALKYFPILKNISYYSVAGLHKSRKIKFYGYCFLSIKIYNLIKHGYSFVSFSIIKFCPTLLLHFWVFKHLILSVMVSGLFQFKTRNISTAIYSCRFVWVSIIKFYYTWLLLYLSFETSNLFRHGRCFLSIERYNFIGRGLVFDWEIIHIFSSNWNTIFY